MEEKRRKHEPPTETERLHAAANANLRNRADGQLVITLNWASDLSASSVLFLTCVQHALQMEEERRKQLPPT